MHLKHILHSFLFLLLFLFIGKAIVVSFPSSVHAQTTSFFDCGKAPYSTSPACKGEHPRLHITKDTLPQIKQKIQTYYMKEYQEYVSWADSVFQGNGFTAQGPYFATDLTAFAFIGLMGDIPGITYQHTPAQFARKSVDVLLQQIATNAWIDYTHVIAYDWSYPAMTLEERKTIVDWMVNGQMTGVYRYDNNLASGGPWIPKGYFSSFMDTMHPFYVGLAFYGDGIADQIAQKAVDSFHPIMLDGGFIDAQNLSAEEGGGDSEWTWYAILNYRDTHPLVLDGWSTAAGEDYLIQDTALTKADKHRYWAQVATYNVSPFLPDTTVFSKQWLYMKVGAGGSAMESFNAAISSPPYLFPSHLKPGDPDMAALTNWFLKNRVGGYPVSYPWQKIILFLFGAPDIGPKSPQDLGLPLTKWFKGMGEVVLRAGFDDPADTAIALTGGRWDYPGHAGPSNAPTLVIEKYGPLVLNRGSSSWGTIGGQNWLLFEDPGNPGTNGFRATYPPDSSKMTVFVPGSVYDKGGIQRVESVPGAYDYVDIDYTRYYTIPEKLSNRVVTHTRQAAYFRPQTNTQPDYLVIIDRAKSANTSIVKKWLMHTGFLPNTNGIQTMIDAKHYESIGADEMVITNKNSMHPSAHGRLFVKILSPDKVNIISEYPTITDPGDQFHLDEVGDFYVGTWETQTIPVVQQTDDIFLHVLQPADANTTNTMTPTSRIDGDTMVGAYIQDETQGYKVAMFSKTEINQTQSIYTIDKPKGTVSHLIADLEPNSSYTLTKDAALSTVNSTDNGTLSFTSTKETIFSFLKVGTLSTPSIILTKQTDKTTVKQGDIITYTITYENKGSADAVNISLTDTIPQGTTYVIGSATNNGIVSGTRLTWSIASLNANKKDLVSFQVKVD